ncbi:MAG: hypothetical protein RL226_1855 [Bacteroidota bacterium]|jgi:hypothetical protein
MRPILTFLLLSHLWVSGQESIHDTSSCTCFPENPELNAFFQAHGYVVAEATEKALQVPDIYSLVADFNTEQPALCEHQLCPGLSHHHYRIGDSGQVLIVYNEAYLRKLFARYELQTKSK